MSHSHLFIVHLKLRNMRDNIIIQFCGEEKFEANHQSCWKLIHAF